MASTASAVDDAGHTHFGGGQPAEDQLYPVALGAEVRLNKVVSKVKLLPSVARKSRLEHDAAGGEGGRFGMELA